MGSVTNGSAATSSSRNPFRSWNVLSASLEATGGNFGSSFGSATRCSAPCKVGGPWRNIGSAGKIRAAASLEVKLTDNLMDPLSMSQLRGQFNRTRRVLGESFRDAERTLLSL